MIKKGNNLDDQISAVPLKRRVLLEKIIKDAVNQYGEVLKKLAYE